MVDIKTQYVAQFAKITAVQAEYVSLVKLQAKFTAELRKYVPDTHSGIGFTVSEQDVIDIQFLGFTVTAIPRLVRAPAFRNELLIQWAFYDNGKGIEHWSFGLAADGWLYDKNSLTQRPERLCQYEDGDFAKTLVARVYIAFMMSPILNP